MSDAKDTQEIRSVTKTDTIQAVQKGHGNMHRPFLMRKWATASNSAAILAISLLVVGCGGAGSSAAPVATTSVSSQGVEVYETRVDQSRLLSRQSDATATTAVASGTVLNVDPDTTYQTFVGAGAAITDASAFLIQHRLSGTQRDALMSDLFSSNGIGLSFTRLTIGASDFSQSFYSYDDVPIGQTDPALTHFSIAPMRADVLPTVKQAIALNPHLSVMASPWSAPAWMKSSKSLITGSLDVSAYPYYADYLSRYVKAVQAEGVPLFALTLQNEPGFEPPTYPGMRVDPASRAAFIGQYLGPKLQADGITAKLLDYDHNWDLPTSPISVLDDPIANPFIAGVAWHCYAGDVGAQSRVHDAYPQKEVYFTECSGGQWAPDFGASFDWMMDNLIIGSTQNWAKGVIMWNLALDENSGPHSGGCANCRGVVTINSATGAVTRNIEYYALGHISKFVRPGAVRVASDSKNSIKTVAFKNSDDNSVVLIALNGATGPQTFAVQKRGYSFIYSLPAGAAATFVWK